MKTGAKRRVRHRASACVAIALAVALPLALTACDDHSPVAAPTSTLPAQDPADDSSGETEKPSIPEYDTELDLNDEEKEAVEGALVAFEGYIETINRVFSSGGKDIEGAGDFADESSLDALVNSANELKANGQYMAGEYDFYDVRVQEIDMGSDQSKNGSVVLLYCSHDSKHAVVDLGDSMPEQPVQSLTMKHTATRQGPDWKISNQELWSKQCE